MNNFVSPAEVEHLQRLTEVLGGTRDKRGHDAVGLFRLDVAGMAVGGTQM
jgi:hypothetical protein